jgi:hypothetical protein
MRLSQIPTFTLSKNDLTSEMKVKIADTVRYSLSQNPDQSHEEVIKRCKVAVFAEYFVANWLDGYVNHGSEDVKDPYTWAWDVLAHPRYTGLRVEVKTHQSTSKWISVTTGQGGEFPKGTGINIGPFLNFKIADCIIILDVTETTPDDFLFTLKFVGDHNSLRTITRKSNYSGWYLNL